MRPSLLDPLFASVQSLKGIGPRYAELLKKLCGPHVWDLLKHKPMRTLDRRHSPAIASATPGQLMTLDVEIQDIRMGQYSQPTRIRAGNDTGFLDIVYFHAREDYIEKTYPVGEVMTISGMLDDYQGRKQMTHPDYALPLARKQEIPALEPVYALTAGLPAKNLLKAIALAYARAPELPEWNDAAYMQKHKWPAWKTALGELHHPHNIMHAAANSPASSRLAYDELLASQLALAITREKQREWRGQALKGTGKLRAMLEKRLPFTPTGAQRRAFGEIDAEMEAPKRMLRLLQGDVGAGKTLVALYAMLHAVEAGTQAVLMAPTEILARQHLAGITKFLGDMPVNVVFLSGKLNAAARNEATAQIADGTAQIIIGTHALFQEDVTFHQLGLTVIDEQHRFGVHQRLALSAKGAAPDLLVMTATPIPRTLTLSYYGDMETSRLDEKPAGRLPIDTRALPIARLPEVVEALSRKIQAGEKIYWVCPLVEESELVDLAAATERFAALSRFLGEDDVRLVHGQMKPAERDAAMKDFALGNAHVLVATTVIEVGVDVPTATLIVIEHAERFGLAQLHQLRGRVGRSDKQSSCLLLYQEPLGEIATERLKIMRDTNDGFRIAEEDLRLRGPGEILGARQSGMPEFYFADLAQHHDLLLAARDDAKLILSKDADLQSERGKALRHLLYLFEYDQAIKTLRAG